MTFTLPTVRRLLLVAALTRVVVALLVGPHENTTGRWPTVSGVPTVVLMLVPNYVGVELCLLLFTAVANRLHDPAGWRACRVL